MKMNFLRRSKESKKKHDRSNMPLPKPPEELPDRTSTGDPRYHASPLPPRRPSLQPDNTDNKTSDLPASVSMRERNDQGKMAFSKTPGPVPPRQGFAGDASSLPPLPPKPGPPAHPNRGNAATSSQMTSIDQRKRNVRGNMTSSNTPGVPPRKDNAGDAGSTTLIHPIPPVGRGSAASLVPGVHMNRSKWQVPLHGFESYVSTIQQRPEGFSEQFKDLANVGTSQSTAAAKDRVNTRKNQFNNVVPYDESRVKLTGEEDYINASYIDGCKYSPGYIACQYPPSGSVSDWWEMIWEKNIVRVVLMESPARGRGRNLWPEEKLSISDYGSFKVHWVEETTCDFCVTRKMFIQKEWFRRPVILHELTTASFDQSESTITSLVNFRQLVHHESEKDKTRLLVCCRLGAGRTGTFICLDRVVRAAEGNGLVEIYHTLQSMRRQRMLLVKSVEEYELIHLCVGRLITRNMISVRQENLS